MLKEVPMHASRSILRNCSRSLLCALLLVTVLMLPAAVCGQAYFGTVSGELTDATGAVVQRAKVVLTDQQKGFAFTTTSDSNGRYLFRSIPPGCCGWAEKERGSKKRISANLKVDVNANATANLTFRVGGASQTVEVG